MDIGDGVHKKPTKSPIYSKSLLVGVAIIIMNEKIKYSTKPIYIGSGAFPNEIGKQQQRIIIIMFSSQSMIPFFF